jgi:hypothetical protein
MKNKDKAFLVASPLGGYSHLPDKYVISYMNPDGTLNLEKLTKIVRSIANTGANTMREFPYWLQSSNEIGALSPFRVEAGQMVFQERYFQNWKIIAKIANDHGLTLIFSLYNNSSTRQAPGVYDPWRQWNGDRSFFYSAAAAPHMEKWESKILDNFKGLDVQYETINEASFKHPEVCADIYIRLIQAGVPASRIHIGIDYGMKEILGGYHAGQYKKFRERVVAALGIGYETK